MERNIWQPVTCKCRVVEERDTPEDAFRLVFAISKCPAHADVPDEELYGVMISNPDSEGHRFAETLRAIEKYAGIRDLNLEEMEEANGRMVVKGHFVKLSYVGRGAKRKMVLEIQGTSRTRPNKKQAKDISDHLKTKFGAGMVEIL